jgi:hypothetical protein
MHWIKNNATERWNKRHNETVAPSDELLVLKSSYNTGWNYLNTKELTETILGFWTEWITRAKASNYSKEASFVMYSRQLYRLVDCHGDFLSSLRQPSMSTLMPDITKIGFHNHQMIVSKQCTANLFNLACTWKHIV